MGLNLTSVSFFSFKFAYYFSKFILPTFNSLAYVWYNYDIIGILVSTFTCQDMKFHAKYSAWDFLWTFWSWLLQHIQRFVHQKGTPLHSFLRFFLLIMYGFHFFIFRTYKLKESIIFMNKMVPSFYRVLFFLFPSYLLCSKRKCIYGLLASLQHRSVKK